MKNESTTIDVEAVKEPAEASTTTSNAQMAVARVESGAVGRAMTVNELHERLEFVRRVMKQEMKEGQDYGKVPGCGDKPCLLQPGAQKLLMTFNLREQVKREALREFPSMAVPGHREYEFVVTVFPSGLDAGHGWDGVGTCSTLESKYRYRKQERRCPECGKEKIIEGKAEFGGGWLCWKKKGGCGAKFEQNDPRIISQEVGTTEYENPADYWNTVRKMGFKRALVAAAINATNTSELWTQDVEDMAGNAENAPKKEPVRTAPGQQAAGHPPAATKPTATAKPASTPPPAAKPAPKPTTASAKTRDWMIQKLKGEGLEQIALEYYHKLTNPAVLMPLEGLEDLPLRFVPVSWDQLKLLYAAIKDFGNGDEAKHAFAMNAEPPPAMGKQAPPAAKPPAAAPGPAKPAAPAKAAPVDPERWRDIIVPIPNKGQKRGDYIVNPDTIGSLYDQCKSGTEEACKRLWGFVSHFEPKPWMGRDNVQRPPSDTDLQFRAALDQFKEWHDRHGKDTIAPPPAMAPSKQEDSAGQQAQGQAYSEDEETPFDRL